MIGALLSNPSIGLLRHSRIDLGLIVQGVSYKENDPWVELPSGVPRLFISLPSGVSNEVMSNIPRVWFGQCPSPSELTFDRSHVRLIPVTAASAGLGRSLVELILKGGDIAVATLRTPSALNDLKQEYDENQLLLLPLDVTNIGQIRSAFQAATDKYGRIDFVYNLAGHGLIGEVEGTPEEVARAMFEVNFWGATRISNEAVRVFREVNKPQGGHLFVITSLVGLKPMAGTGFYAATKHGQASLC